MSDWKWMTGALLGLWSLWGAPAGAQTLARRPYLQTVTPTSAIVVWTTTTPTDSLVRYGATPTQLTQSAPLAAATTQHEVHLGNLTPGTRYYYSVGNASGVMEGGDLAHSFVTSPPRGSRQPFRAWIVGDSGTGDLRQRQVIDAMEAYAGRRQPDLYLHMGDMAYTTGTTQQFTATGTYTDLSTQPLTDSVLWESSDESIATISKMAGPGTSRRSSRRCIGRRPRPRSRS